MLEKTKQSIPIFAAIKIWIGIYIFYRCAIFVKIYAVFEFDVTVHCLQSGFVCRYICILGGKYRFIGDLTFIPNFFVFSFLGTPIITFLLELLLLSMLLQTS